MMMAILIMLLAISMEASKVFGSSSRDTIRFQETSCLVLRILMSLNVREKKATSEPERTNDRISRKSTMIARIVVAWGLITSRLVDMLDLNRLTYDKGNIKQVW